VEIVIDFDALNNPWSYFEENLNEIENILIVLNNIKRLKFLFYNYEFDNLKELIFTKIKNTILHNYISIANLLQEELFYNIGGAIRKEVCISIELNNK